ncbi:ERF family protein [Cronobacter sakazakii]|uniref:ERF family protein n=1 Tax=Cronobacter sakazakii TaxID=28141 RepID=UPI000CF095FA|nr:ERF family protein [Cronobacter sakazakii]ELY2854097.1 ERF family protein [Cronobacter dublinensis]EGT5185840.1 single-stranded DNA-binding protein [Cronobacter sakazakii]EGT5704859.1 single-stranded DNA-binding protein [Cronobacter sakazakii]EJG0747468.1 ERF family protein [Cronobacter sakazakii]EJG0831438.1 ERF family protein [Cronobacter sakazakii]
MTEKLVYQAISAVAKEMAATGISKDRTNTQQNFKFRGIDQVYNALAPALVNHGLLILPRITERTVTERTTPKGTVLFYVVVKAEFDFVSTKDGSVHTVVTYGEAMDSGDKATNKAMSIAYKYAAFQAFCIPTEETAIDADAEVHHIQPADADTILAEFTQYAGTENDAKKLQEQYASTWTRLNGFPEHQVKCKDVTGIRIKELKQAA